MGLVVDPAAVVPGWGFGTGVDDFGLISTVATDSRGSVYVLSRVPKGAMHRFDAEGNWLGDWDFPFPAPHGLWISRTTASSSPTRKSTWCASSTGKEILLQTIGTPGRRANRGSRSIFPPERSRVLRAISTSRTDMARTGCIDSVPMAPTSSPGVAMDRSQVNSRRRMASGSMLTSGSMWWIARTRGCKSSTTVETCWRYGTDSASRTISTRPRTGPSS